MRKYIFEARMEVRDYECDIEGIVLQYKVPLRCDDEFISRMWLEKDSFKYIFHHDIYRASDEAICFKAKVMLVCLINGRLGESEEYDRAFAPYI